MAMFDLHQHEPITVGLERASVCLAGQTILDNISVRFDRPEITVIHGPNGAGKSTFLSALAGLIPLTSGQHLRLESDGRTAPITRIGYVLQKPVMFRRSVKDNIHIAMTAANLNPKHHAEHYHHILSVMAIDHIAHKSAFHLSQGERQRLAVARVLAMRPGILMLDEATNSLDQDSVRILEQKTRHYADSGMPVLWVTHSIEQTKRIADRVISLDHGQIKSDQKARQFLK